MDPLRKLQPVLTMLKRKFQQFFKPFQKLVIDKSLLLFKGRLSFKQYIPTKRPRFGIKLFMLCNCETGMILDFILYTGKKTEIPSNDTLALSGAVVKQLMQPKAMCSILIAGIQVQTSVSTYINTTQDSWARSHQDAKTCRNLHKA